ncbi:MAG: GTPase Era [Bacteroides sp.]|nr:GTPase Era [Prevotella sp.]MCM1406860.1 GTPase Era [Treponema brennaborense]MCM1470811.1 GTPase Era [Bacteroides sp.]
MPDKSNEQLISGNQHSRPPLIKKAGTVALIGRPSAGKSTFLNTAAGEKISIVSPVPQTTRNAIRGIVNTSLGQLVFIDTPGYHNSEKKLNLRLRSIAEDNLADADAALYIIDASREPAAEESAIAEIVGTSAAKTVIALNKTDLPSANSAKLRSFANRLLPDIPAERVFEISAEKDRGVDDVLRALYAIVPEGVPLYPEEFYTDQEVDFRIAEIIREKAINVLFDELPHALYVEIADMEQRKDGRVLWVRAFLVVERESQKGMVIGSGASKIKNIRIESIKALRKIFPWRTELDLQVKVHKNWRQKDLLLNRLVH